MEPGRSAAPLARGERAVLTDLVHRTFGHSRFTQDSPVRPDVWLSLWEDLAQGLADPRPDLMIQPRDGVPAGSVAVAMELNLVEDPDNPALKLAMRRRTQLAYSRSTVHAHLTVAELIRAVVPMTDWWHRLAETGTSSLPMEEVVPVATLGHALLQSVTAFAASLKDRGSRYTVDDAIKERRTSFQLYRFVALASFTVLWQRRLGSDPAGQSLTAVLETRQVMLGVARSLTNPDVALPGLLAVLNEAMGIVLETIDKGCTRLQGGSQRSGADRLVQQQGDLARLRIHSVALNRRAEHAATRSRRTVKADATHRLFQTDTTGIRWAVVDSGIDARHAAFGGREGDDPAAFAIDSSRIVRSYDFTYARELLATARLPVIAPDLPATNRRALDTILQGEDLSDLPPQRRRRFDIEIAGWNSELQVLQNRWTTFLAHMATTQSVALERVAIRRESGAPVDWSLIEPLLEIPHAAPHYRPPLNEHGTHVAGILAGDWPQASQTAQGAECGPDGFQGVCPRLALYDIRAFDSDGRGREDTLIYALQFIEHLNRSSTQPVIHGVNLSLAVGHDVQAYACGQTLVCQASNQLVRSGVVVVAAAGNMGFEGDPGLLSTGQNARDISITDPGNADLVITVGATHRDKPHTYGVSYFSSRGPTADGRMKPDLVAPGEKILGPVPGNDALKLLDGTSMAAPHVSAVAAMLMARNRELIGQPLRIKAILMDSAMDLGRLPAFQGAGLLDALRALQSV